MKNKILNSILKKFGLQVTNSDTDQGWRPFDGFSFGNAAKVTLTNQTALTISTVFAAMSAISEDIAKLPIDVSQVDGEKRIQLNDHPLNLLLNRQPNPLTNAMTLRETLTGHALGWGNGYAEIQRDTGGKAIALWMLRPDMVQIKRLDNGSLLYEFRNKKGGTIKILGEDVFHIHGLGFDGIQGYNVIQMARETLGLAKATEVFGGTFFGNGCNQSAVLRHPNNLIAPAQDRLREQIQKHHNGVTNAHKLLILEEGMELAGNTIPPDDSQFLQTREFSVVEICRWFRIPPIKVQDLSRSTFNNIEQQNINYVTDSLTGWLTRWESEIWSKLLTPLDKSMGVSVKHNVNALLRGDIKSRGIFYKTMWSLGAFSTNEIRSLEDMNPVDGGDKHFVPLNHTTLQQAGSTTVASPIAAMVDDISGRLAAVEVRAISSYIAKNESDDLYKARVNKFYDKHEEYISVALKPLDSMGCKAVVIFDDLTIKTKIHAGIPFSLDTNRRKQEIKEVILRAMNDV